ncbi:MAG TPA: enolase C-terminal domain-like protein [Terriglobia bacterium]|nr:enolase C-terminal domain-like protein [Terriglobia bacterium]
MRKGEVMMGKVKRRAFLKSVTAVMACTPAILKASAPKRTDIRIEDVSLEFKDYAYRVPIKFGGTVTSQITLLNVTCAVSSPGGKTAKGFGEMPLANTWSFPSRVLSYDATQGAMQTLAKRISTLTGSYKEYGHPIDLNWALEPQYLQAAQEITRESKLAEPIPKLCTLVTASAFDAAVHDAYGKLHGLNCYHTYGPEFMNHDLSYYVGPEYKGEYPDKYILKEPKPRMPLYHLVSAIDPLVDSDIKHRVNDGLPETLPEWINYNGLTHFKIKLDGDDLQWDSERVLSVDRVATETETKRGVAGWVYSLDFNERCPNVQYLVDFLHLVEKKSPGGFARIQYVEQPTARDLDSHRQNVMFEAAKLKPVVIDESLTDLHALLLSREMGYTGAALKACKGQSTMMILTPVMEKNKMFLCVQDLTCPGASLIQSASLAAHVPGVKAIEANSRQYVPAANQGWEKRFPGVFHITDGTMDTSHLDGLGIGAV